MTSGFLASAVILVLAVAGLLAAEYRDSQLGKWLAKPTASTAFIAAALSAGALDTAYGTAVLVALVLSWWGDVLLIPKGARGAFLGGLVAFLLGHVGFAVAFVVRGASTLATVVAMAALVPVSAAVLRWLWPHVGDRMRAPVVAYIVVISTMVALAVGTVAEQFAWLPLVAALGFYLSDLSVAMDRFIGHRFANRAWGLPLYYAAQLLFAASVAAPAPR